MNRDIIRYGIIDATRSAGKPSSKGAGGFLVGALFGALIVFTFFGHFSKAKMAAASACRASPSPDWTNTSLSLQRGAIILSTIC